MNKFHAILLLLGLPVLGALAQQSYSPHLAYLYPAGGRAGTTFQVTVGGQYLLSVSNALVSGSGISVAILDRTRPMGQKDFNDLRERMKALQDKFKASRVGNATGTNVWTAADVRERNEIVAKLLKNPPNRKANPAMLDTVTLRVTLATNLPPGDREIRLASPFALSNPMKFCVGALPEVTKEPAKAANPDLDRILEKLGRKPAAPGTPKYEAAVSLPVTINGQIMPGGVDRYRFAARRGQHLVITAAARTLIPYLADAVPGWFEANLTVFDAKGREVAADERFRFKPEPVIHLEVPADGEYTVEIHDSIFRGREDFVYRLTLGELPFVTGIYPLGGPVGQNTTVALTGWNLREHSLVCDNTEVEPGVRLLTGDFLNAVPFATDDLPETRADEGAVSTATAQTLTLPVIVNGRLNQPGVNAVFQFAGHAGQAVVAEVMARRVDSPLDSFLRLTDAAGKQLAFNDDFEDKGSGLETHHADSWLTATLPADGTYFIHLSDTQGQGGPEYAYRLRLSEPRPDFALRVSPSSLALRAGMSQPVTAYVIRRDGFTNAIDLQLAGAAAGFSLSGAQVAAAADKVQFTLKGPPQWGSRFYRLSLTGSAVVAGRVLRHPAVPADDLMQAFLYRHLVPAQELAVMVGGNGRPFAANALRILTPLPVKIRAGGTAHIRVATPSAYFADRFRLELNDAPEGMTLVSATPAAYGMELVVAAADKMQPDVRGNLIFGVQPKEPEKASSDKQKKPGAKSRLGVVATLPAVAFEVTE